MGASGDINLKPKNIDELIEGLKKSAKSSGFNFKGDKKSGSATNNGATVQYVVKGQDVTITYKNEWDFLELERVVKQWLR
jgi:hypothetical protein